MVEGIGLGRISIQIGTSHHSGERSNGGKLPPDNNHGHGFDIKSHVFQPVRRKEPSSLPEETAITCQSDLIETCDQAGNLGLILRFSGIEFTGDPFHKGKQEYGPKDWVLWTKIRYAGSRVLNQRAFLILATFGDILESQVVERKMDLDPFFCQEMYLPQLTKIYDPTTMTAQENNGLVVIKYRPF